MQPKEERSDRLESARGKHPWLLRGKPPIPETRAFEGTVGADSFKLKRVIQYGNSFLPVVRGSVTPLASGGSEIRLLMMLHPMVAVFMAVWFGGLAVAMMSILKTNPVRALAVPAGMFLLGMVGVSVGFFPEAAEAEKRIRECVKGG